MDSFPPLKALGRRIIVLGPTNSGKSTLAAALAARLDIPAVHLDQYRHLPHTNWVERPDAEFTALHDAAILRPEWVMDGSYSKLMPQRVARASGVIVLDDTLPVRLRRYLWRSAFQKHRAGGLDGNQDGVRVEMLKWLWKTRNKSDTARQFALGTGLPYAFVHNGRQLGALYDAWGLKQPQLQE